MERAEGSAEKAEISWEKLRRVGKSGGNSTPSASFWRINELGLSANCLMFDATNFSQGRIISSRKLAAALWELHPYKLLHDSTRRRLTVPPPRLRLADEDVGGSESLRHRFHLTESSRKLRRRVRVDESPIQHHRSIEKSNRATHTVSTSSCSSSMEIAPCNLATASTSTELEAKNGKSTYSLKTSTELLKVLNRVWSLEEQQVSSISLIKGLKKELDRARFHAEELSGGELLRKTKEQDMINARFQSIRDELQNERKLMKNSKSLQRKLTQELCEVKSSLVRISKELEGERMSRVLLEELCDELAWGLRDCEKEMEDLKQKSDKDLGERDDHDQLILRIAQAWLDERRNVVEKNPTIQNPSSQIEESHFEEMMKQKQLKEKLESSDSIALSPSRLQAKFKEHMTRAMSNGISRNQTKDAEQKAENFEGDKDEVTSELDSDSAVKNIIRYGYSFSENGMQCNKDHLVASSLGRSFHSPVREWTEKLPAQNLDTSETPLKFLCELKGSTLKAKLSETRSGGQKSRSRQKASIYPS